MILTAILLIVSFSFKAIMDMSAKDHFNIVFWNKTQSWQNKYAFPLVKNYNHWYYFGLIKPIYKERFPFSTTVFVFLTDGWHLSQFVFLNCLFLAMALLTNDVVLSFIGIRLIYSITFNLIYK